VVTNITLVGNIGFAEPTNLGAFLEPSLMSSVSFAILSASEGPGFFLFCSLALGGALSKISENTDTGNQEVYTLCVLKHAANELRCPMEQICNHIDGGRDRGGGNVPRLRHDELWRGPVSRFLVSLEKALVVHSTPIDTKSVHKKK
jgi:hypothetical protein